MRWVINPESQFKYGGGFYTPFACSVHPQDHTLPISLEYTPCTVRS